MIKRIAVAFATILLLVLVSCTKEDSPIPQSTTTDLVLIVENRAGTAVSVDVYYAYDSCNSYFVPVSTIEFDVDKTEQTVSINADRVLSVKFVMLDTSSQFMVDLGNFTERAVGRILYQRVYNQIEDLHFSIVRLE